MPKGALPDEGNAPFLWPSKLPGNNAAAEAKQKSLKKGK